MTWNTLDIVVVLLFLIQVITWVVVLSKLWKIKQGPLQHGFDRVGSFPALVGRISETAKLNLSSNAGRALGLYQRVRRIGSRLNIAQTPTGMWVEPRHVKQALGALTLARGRRLAAVKGKAARRRRGVSLAQRIGLLPPLLVRLAPLGRVARIALKTLQVLRR